MGRIWSLDSTFKILLVYCFLIAMHSTSAKEFRIGGKNWWAAPNDTATESLDQWAQRNRFQVGDTLLFEYDARVDSVLVVKSKEDFDNCKTSDPQEFFQDGNTRLNLSRSGPYYFISGNSDRCHQSEKLHLIVMSVRGKGSNVNKSPAPAPAKSPPSPSPSPSPSSSPSPSPSPSEPPSENGAMRVADIWGGGRIGMNIAISVVCCMFFM